MLDFVALAEVAGAEPIQRLARSIVIERGDFNGRILSLRWDNLRTMGVLLETTPLGAVRRLRSWGVLVEGNR